ncbi:hypothetical protein PseBG33_2241 [Pseudomonas synxantha BG33R]|uniref:VOC family protein n=1 Tax=Pseudomonas synxantha TaxID=47883 RepID=UPI00025FF22E|nr:hypothetical protein [Pseudomonas synxantha]EIK67392.1 hypothetical protein PseBG33_2241 [Pseudomonas synxantha BG33R]
MTDTTKSAQVIVGDGPQYALPHVFMFPDQLETFIDKFIAVLGGTFDPISDINLAAVPATMQFTDLYTSVGAISAQAYKDNAPPFPMGKEAVGFAVVDMNKAIQVASSGGAKVLRRWEVLGNQEAMIETPGGVRIQFYAFSGAAPAREIQESVSNTRYYLSETDAEAFVTNFLAATKGTLISDGYYSSEELGVEGGVFRRVQIESTLGNVNIIAVTSDIRDGLKYPYTDIKTDFTVDDLAAVVEKARQNDVDVLVRPEYTDPSNRRAVLRFPGEYVIELRQNA